MAQLKVGLWLLPHCWHWGLAHSPREQLLLLQGRGSLFPPPPGRGFLGPLQEQWLASPPWTLLGRPLPVLPSQGQLMQGKGQHRQWAGPWPLPVQPGLQRQRRPPLKWPLEEPRFPPSPLLSALAPFLGTACFHRQKRAPSPLGDAEPVVAAHRQGTSGARLPVRRGLPHRTCQP